MTRKTYWQSCACYSEHSKDAIKTWFAPLSDDMTPYKADILCEVETDRERRLRAYMTDPAGKKYLFTRTRGKRTFSITMRPITEAATEHATRGAEER